jgi:uncharacterized protein (TIGR03435 family)
MAYQLREYQLIGGPSWLDSESYDILAKMTDEDVEPYRQGGQQMCLSMLRNLLAVRFGLVVHHKNAILPNYELGLAKNGIRPTEALPHPEGASSTSQNPRVMAGTVEIHNASMPFIVRVLSAQVSLPVIDRTGLTGTYDISMHWTPSGPYGRGGANPDLADSSSGCTSIFTALEEQVGLRLRPSKGPCDTVIIDHIEKPTPN